MVSIFKAFSYVGHFAYEPLPHTHPSWLPLAGCLPHVLLSQFRYHFLSENYLDPILLGKESLQMWSHVLTSIKALFKWYSTCLLLSLLLIYNLLPESEGFALFAVVFPASSMVFEIHSVAKTSCGFSIMMKESHSHFNAFSNWEENISTKFICRLRLQDTVNPIRDCRKEAGFCCSVLTF